MQVNETLNDGLKRGYAITVTADELDAKVNEKLAEAQPEVEMKGFRKGKVPMALLKKQFGQRIMGEAMQESVDGAMAEHFEKTGDRPAMQPDVKMNAINDGLLLEAHIYVILKKYFGSDPCYVDLLELLHEVTHQTALGQFLDLTTSEPDKVDFDRFSLGVYTDIVVYKTAFYSFYLPVALGMRLAGITDPTLYVQARAICVEMGEMFQVQDDYLDCYGDPQVTGKVGTDIRDNKCSWLINTALPIASDKQRNVLEANYAKKSDGAERAVRTVYDELDIVGKFRAYEDAANARVLEMIAQVHGMPTTIFTMLLAKIYKRNK